MVLQSLPYSLRYHASEEGLGTSRYITSMVYGALYHSQVQGPVPYMCSSLVAFTPLTFYFGLSE